MHDVGPVQLTPAGITTTFASELAGSSGWANTAPPGGGAGVMDVRMQSGWVGALTATVVGPHRVCGSVLHPDPVYSSAVM